MRHGGKLNYFYHHWLKSFSIDLKELTPVVLIFKNINKSPENIPEEAQMMDLPKIFKTKVLKDPQSAKRRHGQRQKIDV